MSDNEVTFFDYIGIILKYRKLVFGISFFAAIVALLFGVFSKPSFSAEVKLWSDEPNRTFEFLKSREALDGVIEKLHLLDVYGLKDTRSARMQILNVSNISVKGNVITLAVKASDSSLAVDMANELAVRTIEQEAKFSAGVLESQKKLAETQWVFAKELFDKSPIKGTVNLPALPQMPSNNSSFVFVLNSATPPVLESQFPRIVSSTFFAALLGVFFGILLAFIKEYGLRHKEEWAETKRKYLNKQSS